MHALELMDTNRGIRIDGQLEEVVYLTLTGTFYCACVLSYQSTLSHLGNMDAECLFSTKLPSYRG